MPDRLEQVLYYRLFKHHSPERDITHVLCRHGKPEWARRGDNHHRREHHDRDGVQPGCGDMSFQRVPDDGVQLSEPVAFARNGA